MDKINNFDVNVVMISSNNEENTITIDVSVDHFNETQKEIRITTRDILNKLIEKNIEVGNCIKSSVISNKNNNSLIGTWVFELPKIISSEIQNVSEIKELENLELTEKQEKKRKKKEQ